LSLAITPALLLLAGAATAGQVAPDPARFNAIDVFELEFATDPQIAPDGSRVAYVRRSMDIMKDSARSNIWIVDADGQNHRPLLSDAANFSSPRWSPQGDRLAYVSSVEGEQQLFVRWIDSGQTALVTNLRESPQSVSWSPDGRWLAFTMHVKADSKPIAKAPVKPEGAKWADPVKVIDRVVYRADGAGMLEPGFTHVFVVPSEGGTPRQLTGGDFDHAGPLSWTPDAAAILCVANRNADWEYDPQESDIWSVNVETAALTQLTQRDGPDLQPAVSPDGKLVAYTGFDDQLLGYQNEVLYVMNRDGSNSRALTADFDRSVENLRWDSNGRGIYVQFDELGLRKLARVDLGGKIEVLADDIGGTSSDRPYTSGGYTLARTGHIAYTKARPDRPADVAFMAKGQKPRQLTQLNEDLFAHKKLGSVQHLTWKSSFDGRDVHGWVVTPPDFDRSRKYPLVLEIHGGPFAAYGPSFAVDMQRYAAEGYVVLYTNPRGSTSYGAEFANQIHHNYPGQDYDDLISGVDAVLAEGYVDPENLFVTGGSGGGVLTAWIVGKTDRFRAAVVAKPVINWASFALTSDGGSFYSKYWFASAPWEDPDAYWKRSPLSLVGNVTTPTMLLTGESDYRTPISESEQYYSALKLRKVDTVMVRIPGASHGIQARPSNMIAKIDNILAWFERYRTDRGDAASLEASR
jgi:dipeptidyl aminopeptidase/acylaminoacyl peptidase